MAFDFGMVLKDIRKLSRFLHQAPKHTTPRRVHSLRLAIRRFEAAMDALGLDSNANERRLLRKLARLRKRAGNVRDLDVLIGYVDGLGMTGEEECRVKLLEHLGSERDRRSQQLRSVAVKHGESLCGRLKRTSVLLEALAKDSAVGSTSPGHTMLSELRLQRELAAPVRLTSKNLHRYRLKVKELRYMLEMEHDPTDQEMIDMLGQVKDAIGEWHDWQQLLKIARENLQSASQCKLILLLQKTTQQKLQGAIAVVNAGRKQIRP
jgi:CHAD domain-containing protein